MNTFTKTILAGAVALAVSAGPAAAGAISTNTWYTFFFGSTGTPLVTSSGNTATNPDALALDDAPWTFSLTGPAQLLITDLQTSGDQFTLYDNLAFLGQTTTGNPNATSICGMDIGCSLANGNYGSGLFALGAGSHSLTGTFDGVITNGFGAFIVQEVPEPITLTLFGAGLVGAAALRRRKKA